MDTDRNLLFGVLAFQKGVIDADRLAQTCGDQFADVTISLANQLVDREWLTVDQKNTLDQVLDGILQANHGDPEGTLAAMLDGRCLEALRDVARIDPKLEAKLQVPHTPAGPVLIGSLSSEEAESRERYTLTHLYARGGMGQVWLARDPTLGREIALKELRPDQVDNTLVCSRFMTEARVTAQLEHPGIVPVYEMGQGNLPFYTMRFVKGSTLSQATRSYHEARAAGKADSVGLVKLLGAFVGVCNAIAYAHSRGFIHRDLKGQNIVMGAFGEVMVLDWGLAKRIEPASGASHSYSSSESSELLVEDGSAEGNATLPPQGKTQSSSPSRPRLEAEAGPEKTMPGQVLGTPAYMAPEQAEGRQHETDARTDVYGLGGVLYEILTGQPPFHAKSTKELLRKVRHESPRPPRQINPEVAEPLQAICLKALAKVPGQRYDSAADLAQEVQRYLADEPVLAYPEPWTRYAARWARKHRTVVATAAGLLLAASTALSISTVLISRERNEAKIQGEQARQAVGDMYTKVAENWLEDRLDPLQKEFLQKTLDYYEKFTAHAANTAAVRLEYGMAYQRMGEIHRKLGRSDMAEQMFDKALAILEPLAVNNSVDRDVCRALAMTRMRMGDLLFRDNQIERAEPLFSQAEILLEPLVARPAGAVEDRWLLARTLRSKAELLRRKEEIVAAKPIALRACDLLEQVLKADPRSPEARNDLAQANDFLGRVTRELGEMDTYERGYRHAYELLDPLVAEFPTVPRYREAMSNVCNGLGGLEHQTGRVADCETHWRRQLNETERLVQDFPGRPEYQRLLAGGCSNLGGILAEQERFAEAEPILRRGIELNVELVKRLPEDREIDFDLGNCYHNLGYLLLKRGHAEDALATLEQAERINRSLVQKLPELPRCRCNLALVLRWRGEALEALGRPGVQDTYRESVTILEKLAAESPANVLYQLDLARCLNKLGDQMAKVKRVDEAERLYQNALAALSSMDVHDWPVECRREKAMTLSNQGLSRQEAGRADAEEPLRSSVKIAQELASAKTAARKDRQYLAIAHNNLGDTLREWGRNAEARKEFQESVADLEALVAENSGAVEDRYYLGYIYEQQGKLLVRMDKLSEAKLAMEKAVVRQKEAVKLTDGKSLVYRSALTDHLSGFADLCLTLGDYDAAMQAAVDLAKAAPDSGQGCLDAARILARAARGIQADAKLASSRKDKLGRKFLGRTVVMLREAIDVNTNLAESIKNDPVFKELRDHPEFQTMLSSLVELGHGSSR